MSAEHACCSRCGFSLEENLAQLHGLRSRIAELEAKNAAMVKALRAATELADAANKGILSFAHTQAFFAAMAEIEQVKP